MSGGSPCVVVMGGDSCSKGRGFKSHHHILDRHFFIFICCKNYNVGFIRRKWVEEKPGMAHFLKNRCQVFASEFILSLCSFNLSFIVSLNSFLSSLLYTFARLPGPKSLSKRTNFFVSTFFVEKSHLNLLHFVRFNYISLSLGALMWIPLSFCSCFHPCCSELKIYCASLYFLTGC